MKNLPVLLLVWTFWTFLGLAAAYGQDPFAAQVRPTDPLTPREEQKSFTLPPGFEIQLVASEPDIQKPMNLAFDAQGRLWVTDSTEYPFPAPPDRKGRDTIKILDDTDGDGRADEITTFADGLNIPIGLYPYNGGVIAFSIPHIWHLQDTDGDGKADKRRKLYGPMGYDRDTHGLNNSFRRGFDGWLYACHGFNNRTEVAGSDGHRIRMHSGNVYRMRLDGSRVEVFTRGQVNPFGMTMDPLFNLFTADCHSKPINRLLRGGYHPSFGKPHDGLGFIPPMMQHTHGSTAIAGAAYYAADHFPDQYRGDMFSGNVMTSRVNRNSLEYSGATLRARKEPDFLVTSDPWFRPVDIRLGPDGALYIADFYNRIIGHYEVPLDHPGRDRHRGRIWRIVYTGDEKDTRPARKRPDLTRASVEQLIAALDDANLMYRRLAMHQLVDRIGPAAVEPVQKAFRDTDSPRIRSLAVWILHRLSSRSHALRGNAVSRRSASPRDAERPMSASRRGAPERGQTSIPSPPEGERARMRGLQGAQNPSPRPSPQRGEGALKRLLTTAADDPNRAVRVQAMKVLSESSHWSEETRKLALEALRDEDPFVQLAAADALGQHPQAQNIHPLLELLGRVPDDDPHLRHGVRIALRNQLRPAENFAAIPYESLSERDCRAVADVCLALESPQAAAFLVRHLRNANPKRSTVAESVRHAARYVPPRRTEALVRLIRRRFPEDLDFQKELFLSVHEGLQQRGAPLDGAVKSWGARLARRLLESVDAETRSWVYRPTPGDPKPQNPWAFETRRCADGRKARLLSSFPHGENLTGILQSRVFEIPRRLQFFLAGHNDPPQEKPDVENVVRLRDAETHDLLAEAVPPRNDVAQSVQWDLSEHAGRRGYLEVIDGKAEPAYAWLAVGRFEPVVVSRPKLAPRQADARLQAAADVAARLKRDDLRPPLAELLTKERVSLTVRESAAEALAALQPDSRIAALVPMIGDPAIPSHLRTEIGRILVDRDPERISQVLAEAVQAAPSRLQVPLARTLVGDRTGAEALFGLIEKGHASARLLQDPTVQSKLRTILPERADRRIEQLTSDLPPEDESTAKLIAQRVRSFPQANTSPKKGAALFEKHCAACHQVDGEGSVIGPQLDGIGNRGLERLVEDVLDPNRNVDVAFRTTTLVLESGKVVTGLLNREEGATLVLVDEKGKEFTIPKDQVVRRVRSRVSLMPQNVAEVLSKQEFHDLMAYLLSLRDQPESNRDGDVPR